MRPAQQMYRLISFRSTRARSWYDVHGALRPVADRRKNSQLVLKRRQVQWVVKNGTHQRAACMQTASSEAKNNNQSRWTLSRWRGGDQGEGTHRAVRALVPRISRASRCQCSQCVSRFGLCGTEASAAVPPQTLWRCLKCSQLAAKVWVARFVWDLVALCGWPGCRGVRQTSCEKNIRNLACLDKRVPHAKVCAQ